MAISCLEYDLEKMIYDNPSESTEIGFVPFFRNTERQFRLPSGKIIDLLTWEVDGDALYSSIIELKKDAVDICSLSQIAQYFSEFADEIHRSFRKASISLVICGASVNNDVVSIACMDAKINLYSYSLGFKGLRFTQAWKSDPIEIANDHPTLQQTSVSTYLQSKLGGK